jgi:hypothetical protein
MAAEVTQRGASDADPAPLPPSQAPPASDESTREAVRAKWHAAIPAWYSPWAHLAFPSVVGLAVIAWAIRSISDLRLWQLAMVPAVWTLSNAVEWRAHRDVLHRRTWPLEELYDRHTPNHHVVFVTEDMSLRSTREFKFVLLPFYGIVAIFAMVFPIALLLGWLGQHNLSALFLATTMGYVLSYEWLHLAYHLSPTSLIGRLPVMGVLRHHHATHHDPRLMRRWNFNVTVPLWDLIRGTTYRGTTYDRREQEGGKAGELPLG